MAVVCDTPAPVQLDKHQRNVSTDTSSSMDSFEQEEYEYPQPDWVVIRNGFFDGPKEGPVSSLEGFFKERNVRSCPSSRLAGPRSKLAEVDEEVSESTSAGSSDAGDADEGVRAMAQAPTGRSIAFEGPMFVQNTFIHFPPERPQSLVEFIRERQVRSCPSSRLSAPSSGIEAAVLEGYFEATPSHLDHSDVDSEDFDMLWPSTSALAPAALPTPDSVPVSAQVPLVPGLRQGTVPPAPVRVLRLEDMLADPQPGPMLMPTIGSMGHYVGKCKPCAFAYTKGCADGVNCQFCHLCEPGEKKRRRKEKVAFRREAVRARRESARAREQTSALGSYLAAACVSLQR